MQKFFVFLPALLGIAAFWLLAGQPQPMPYPGIAAEHRLQSVSYAPYAKDQSPFTSGGRQVSGELLERDLSILSKRFSCIRTYSATGLDALPQYAEKYGMQVLLGAWVSGNPEATMHELENAIDFARKHPGIIRAVVVGNETLLRREVTAAQLTTYIRQVKSALPEVPVTYADVWEFWLKNTEVAEALDFVTIHILPYWEDNPVAIDGALAHVLKVREEVSVKIPGKDILIGETGWPSRGRMRNGALPSPGNQARYLRGFVALAEQQGWQYNLIEAFDQPWKRTKEGVVGGYWGLYDKDRNDKNVLSGGVALFPGWRGLLGMSAGLALLALLVTPLPAAMGAGVVLRLSAVLAGGALLLVMQGEMFSTTLTGRWDYLWGVLLLAVAGGVYLFGLRAVAGGIPLHCRSLAETLMRPRGQGSFAAAAGDAVRLAMLVCVLVVATSLAFDGRYQSFNNAVFAIPALAYAMLNGRGQTRPTNGMPEKCFAFLLAAAGLIPLLPEPRNLQAVVWACICLLLAYPLWSAGRQASLRPLLPYALFALAAYGLLYVARERILAAEELVGVCAESPSSVLCRLRASMGAMIHFRAYGWTALSLSGLAILCNMLPLTLLALAASLAGLIFYNADMGSVALVLLVLFTACRLPPAER